jgi:hypothetical protein
MSSLQKLKAELAKLENGSALLLMVDSAAEDFNRAINEANQKLATFEKHFGTDSAQYENQAKKLKEFETLAEKNKLLTEQYKEATASLETIKKDVVVSAVCAKEGANKAALLKLLPQDAELVEGGIKQGDKVVTLKEYVKGNEDLKIFEASIFPSQKGKEGKNDKAADDATTTTTSVGISNERGDDSKSDPIRDTAKNYEKNRDEAALERLKGRFKF